MDEQDILGQLGMSLVELKEVLAKKLNKISDDITIEYDNDRKGVFRINNGSPYIKVDEVDIFDGKEGVLNKSIFYGLPENTSSFSHDKPIGGELCATTDLYIKGENQKYPTRRSTRYRSCTPVGFDEKTNWRKGHILFAWLVDRFFYEDTFSSIEKKMMYFTQSKDSNEPVQDKGGMFNHFRYEELLQKWLEEDEIPFTKFRYSVLLIYKNETEKVPIATLLQLDTDNVDYQFNVLAPNIEIEQI